MEFNEYCPTTGWTAYYRKMQRRRLWKERLQVVSMILLITGAYAFVGFIEHSLGG